MSDVITFMVALSATAKQATTDLAQVAAAHSAGVDSSGGRTGAGGGGPQLGATSATNTGYGLPGEMIAALKLLEGRT